jgi:hypothetical protein
MSVSSDVAVTIQTLMGRLRRPVFFVSMKCSVEGEMIELYPAMRSAVILKYG